MLMLEPGDQEKPQELPMCRRLKRKASEVKENAVVGLVVIVLVTIIDIGMMTMVTIITGTGITSYF